MREAVGLGIQEESLAECMCPREWPLAMERGVFQRGRQREG